MVSLARSPAHDDPGTRLEQLGPSALIEACAFLERHADLHVFLHALLLRDALAHPRDEFWGAWRDDELEGLLYLGMDSGLVTPVATRVEILDRLARCAAERLAALPPRRFLVGERRALERLAATLAPLLPPPRLVRDQLYLAVERGALAPYRLPQLRPARPGDEALLFESGIALRREELDEDPVLVDEPAYRQLVQSECRDGSTFLWREGEELRFRATVSAVTAQAAQIAAVYTPPSHRDRGVATHGVGELCHRLLERVDSVCLFVNDFNAPALAVYRRLGFHECALWRSVFWSPPWR